VTEGQKVQPLHVGSGLPLGDDDGHRIKEEPHHQASSCPIHTKLGVPAAIPMDKSLMKRAVHYLQFPHVQTPLLPPPQIGQKHTFWLPPTSRPPCWRRRHTNEWGAATDGKTGHVEQSTSVSGAKKAVADRPERPMWEAHRASRKTLSTKWGLAHHAHNLVINYGASPCAQSYQDLPARRICDLERVKVHQPEHLLRCAVGGQRSRLQRRVRGRPRPWRPRPVPGCPRLRTPQRLGPSSPGSFLAAPPVPPVVPPVTSPYPHRAN